MPVDDAIALIAEWLPVLAVRRPHLSRRQMAVSPQKTTQAFSQKKATRAATAS
jgi:hypothetical protein